MCFALPARFARVMHPAFRNVHRKLVIRTPDLIRLASNWFRFTLFALSSQHLNLPWTILIAGATCGVLDLGCALIVFRARGVSPRRALQGIASAALGPLAFQRGIPAATLGTLFHFVIAFSAATVYCLAATRFAVLARQPFLFGPIYGMVVHLFMTFVVLPLSRLNRPFSFSYFFIQLVIHIFAVGLPIALVAHAFLK
jgi:uncharacterized membrane protein YagU involved in acid resistance